jgi:CheY-specific phosphatase CheX
VTIDELRELLILTINRNTSTLNASAIDAAGVRAVIGVEDETSGTLFFLEIQEA